MAQPIAIPEPVNLIPALLAFLPTSFASSRPPPALLPLLSPILRQRIHLHTSSSTDSHDSWIRLLCWDNAKADRLKDIVENANFEPHPVSGEIEMGDVDTITYKRFDYETLKVHIPLADWELSVMYLWCTGGDDGDGWKLTELLPFDSDLMRDISWSKTIQGAEASAQEKTSAARLQTHSPTSSRKESTVGGDNESDYWAMYDGTPSSRTPARRPSVNPAGASLSEEDYYARYGDVQPAMDNHDPDEDVRGMGPSGVKGNALQDMMSRARNPGKRPVVNGITPVQRPIEQKEEELPSIPVRQPSPSSPSSRPGSDTVEKLEDEAEKYASSEIGIRHHISYSVKSMYRLAKSAGINRQDFEDMVQRELETLSILDRDD